MTMLSARPGLAGACTPRSAENKTATAGTSAEVTTGGRSVVRFTPNIVIGARRSNLTLFCGTHAKIVNDEAFIA
jgi:hypothetical protein